MLDFEQWAEQAISIVSGDPPQPPGRTEPVVETEADSPPDDPPSEAPR